MSARSYDSYGPRARVAGAVARQRHVGSESTSKSLSNKTAKFAYHVVDTDFHTIMTMHAPSAYVAAKKVISHLHRQAPERVEKRMVFLMTQQVKLRLSGAGSGRGDQNGKARTSTRIYLYGGKFNVFPTPLTIQRGPRTFRVTGEPEVDSGPVAGTMQKRVLVPFVHREDVKAAYYALVKKNVRPEHFHTGGKHKAHHRLRSKLGIIRKRGPRKAKKAGGSARADFYDVEPRYGGVGRRLAAPTAPVDPYYYGVDPRVAGAYGW
jgi:hypothetical protein